MSTRIHKYNRKNLNVKKYNWVIFFARILFVSPNDVALNHSEQYLASVVIIVGFWLEIIG